MPSSPAFSAIWRSGSCRVRFTMLTPICSSPSTFNQVAGYSDAEPRHVEQDLSHRLDIAQTLAICRSSRLTIAQLHAICRSSPFNGRGYPFVLYQKDKRRRVPMKTRISHPGNRCLKFPAKPFPVTIPIRAHII